MKRTFGAIAATVWVIGLWPAVSLGADEVQFSEPERVAEVFDSTPMRAVSVLEEVLTQAEIDALEEALFPAPSDDRKRVVFEQVQQDLTRLGLPPDDTLLKDIEARIAALAPSGQEEASGE